MDRLYRVVPLSVFLIVFLVSTVSKAERCGYCMNNYALCINETAYYVCPNGEDPLTETVHKCGFDEICTSSKAICVKKTDAKLSEIPCKDNCKKCSRKQEDNIKFSCFSPKQYVICKNGNITNNVGSCNKGEYCNVEMYMNHNQICAPLCVLDFFGYKPTCGNDITDPRITANAPTVFKSPPSLNGLPNFYKELKRP